MAINDLKTIFGEQKNPPRQSLTAPEPSVTSQGFGEINLFHKTIRDRKCVSLKPWMMNPV